MGREAPASGHNDPAAAFYLVSSPVFFLGAVALVNSLRLLGHDEPVFVLDRGLSPDQRDLIAAEATLVAPPRGGNEQMSKAAAPARHPAGTMVLLDADMIATRSLASLIETAGAGKVVATDSGLDRFVAEWGERLDLGPATRRPYVSSCLVVAGGAVGRELVELLDDRVDRVDVKLTYLEDDVADYPFHHAEEDVLNAIIATRVDADQLVTLDPRMAPIPPFEGLRVLDASSLRCAFADATEPYVVHHAWSAKPWLEPTHHGVYSQLLRRLLVGPDVAIRVPERMVPLRLRRGPLAYMARKRVNLGQRFRFHVREPLAARIARPRGASE
jgi:hypothetical protein